MHKLHVFVAGLYVLPLSSVLKFTVYVEPLCLMFQIWVLKVVSVLYFSFFNDFKWFPNLFLNGGAVSPTYFSTICTFSLVVSVIVAWYIKFSERHLPSRGQVVFLGQLQALGFGLSVCCDSIFFIVPTNDLFHVWCRSVTYLDSVPIEKFA